MTEVYAISTNKGGVLKTSLTLNLASILSKKGEKILIIDTDNQGNIALGFGFNPDSFENTLYDVLVNEFPAEKTIVKAYENIDILPSNDDMSFFEFDVLTQKNENERFEKHFELLEKSIKDIKDKYDYIFIDTPPNVGAVIGNVYVVADKVIIPYKPESFSIRSTVKIINLINEFKKTWNPNLEITGVVCTDVKVTNHHRNNIQELRQYAEQNNINVFETEIANSIRYDEAIKNERKPIVLIDKPNTRQKELINTYENLVQEVVLNGKK